MQHKNNTPVNKSVYNLFATGCCVYMTATFLTYIYKGLYHRQKGDPLIYIVGHTKCKISSPTLLSDPFPYFTA